MDSCLRRNDGVALVVRGGFETRPYECRLAGGYFQRNNRPGRSFEVLMQMNVRRSFPGWWDAFNCKGAGL